MSHPKRERVEPGVWRRMGTDGRWRYEITYRDSDGKQRRHVVKDGGKKAAETALSSVKSEMGRARRGGADTAPDVRYRSLPLVEGKRRLYRTSFPSIWSKSP